jgi:hypothetical protein
MHATATFALFRPFLLIAAFAFVVGFVGALAFGGGPTALAESHQGSHAAMVSAPASDEWNFPKKI